MRLSGLIAIVFVLGAAACEKDVSAKGLIAPTATLAVLQASCSANHFAAAKPKRDSLSLYETRKHAEANRTNGPRKSAVNALADTSQAILARLAVIEQRDSSCVPADSVPADTTKPPPDTTTPPQPSDTTKPPPVTGAVVLSPGQSIQAAVDAHPTGTTFRLATGTYSRQTVRPKSGDVFVGDPGAVMDGENVTPYAFETLSSAPVAVTVYGLVLTRYASPAGRAIIQGDNGSGWRIENNEVSYGGSHGIHPGKKAVVVNNKIHHNYSVGLNGYKADSTRIERNEFYANGSTVTSEVNSEAGGIKIFKSYGVIARANNVHDNRRGIWYDTDYTGSVIDSNVVVNNEKVGIWVEITYGAVVRANRVERNGGTTKDGWLGRAGIQTSNSPDVEVVGNTVLDNQQGITGMMASGYVADNGLGPLTLRNYYVHDNTVRMSTGYTGVGQNVGSQAVFTSNNNRFVDNHYTLGTAAGYFAWMDKFGLTAAQWRAYGQDITGTFQ